MLLSLFRNDLCQYVRKKTTEYRSFPPSIIVVMIMSLSLFRNDLCQHVRGVGEDDQLVALLRSVPLDPGRSHSPAGQGLLLNPGHEVHSLLCSFCTLYILKWNNMSRWAGN